MPRFISKRGLGLSGLCLFLCSLNASAQSGLGTMTGSVTDASGAVVEGALVHIVALDTQVPTDTTTSSEGVFNFPSLIPGKYRLEVRKAGFETSVIDSVDISATQTVTLNFSLKVGQASSTVSVIAQAPLLNTSNQAQVTTVEHAIAANLPYPERSALGAAMLVAGVRGNPFNPGQVESENPGVYTGYVTPGSQISVGGAAPGRSSILVDGSDVTQTSYPRAGISVSGDMVEEVAVITGGLPAQYGRTEGGAIIQATKSGTNEFHGGATWRHTDPAIQAYPLGGTLPAAQHQNFFGVYLGGPVVLPKIYNGRNRTFFFAGFEPGRLSNAISGQGQVPTAAELAGDFSNSISLLNTTILANQGVSAALAAPRTGALYYQYPVNAQGLPNGVQYSSASQYVPIPGNNVSAQLAQNPLAQYIVANMPTPQNPGPYFTFARPDGLWMNNGNNVYYVRGVQNTDNRYAFRIDHALSLNDRLFARYTNIPLTSARFFGIPPTSPMDSSPSDQSWASDFALNETHVFSPTIVNELRLMYMRNRQLRAEQGAALSKDWGASLGLTPAVLGVGFPSISFGYSFNNLGYGSGAVQQVDENYQFSDDLTWTQGRHSMKLGVDIRRLQSNQIDLSGLYGGKYTFNASQTNDGSSGGNGLASLMLGLINSFSNTPVEVPAYYRWHYYAGYFQDDIKLLPKLTLNIGLRYEVETPRIEKYNNQGSFIPSLTGTLNGLPAKGAFCFSGACGLPETLWPTNYMGFEPRVGIAWAPTPRITVRTAYDILRVPLSGYGNLSNPNFNVSSYNVGGNTGGVQPNLPVNYITNPVGPLTSALSALQGKGPFFTVQGVTVPFVDQNDVTPYTQQWSLTLQFQLDSKSMLQLAYNGLKGTHLIDGYTPALNFPNLNTLYTNIQQGYNFAAANIPNPYGITQLGKVITETAYTALLPYQNFFNQNLNEYYNRANSSIYNALYVSLSRRYDFGLSLVGSFAWSKAIDSLSGDANVQSNGGPFAPGPVQNQTNFKLDRAVSTFDVPAKTTVGYSYELPLGSGKFLSTHNRILDAIIGNWITSGIFNAQSGQPFAVTLGSAGYFVSSDGTTSVLPNSLSLRPNIVPGQACINPDWRSNPFGEPYINQAMFTVPGSLGSPALGNAPRTLTNCRSPHIITFDANLHRRVRLGNNEKRYLDIGINALNAFNHPVFFLPGNSNTGAYNAFNAASLTSSAVPAFTNQTNFGFLSPGNTEGMSRVVQLSARFAF